MDDLARSLLFSWINECNDDFNKELFISTRLFELFCCVDAASLLSLYTEVAMLCVPVPMKTNTRRPSQSNPDLSDLPQRLKT
jgi:hypothetical protein